ncbi:MAG: efflux RND transporter permease subunit [Pseudomonadota bacterium]
MANQDSAQTDGSQPPLAIVRLATGRPITVLMLFLAVVMFGAVSLSRLSVNLLPDLSYPTLTVRTELTGAAPQELESLITKPIEEAVGTISGVRQVRSVSRTGQSDVTIEFNWGTDMNLSSVDVREKLDVLMLPLEAKRPLLLRFDPSSEPIMRLALGLNSSSEGTVTLQTLKDLRQFAEDDIKDDLESVDGVAAAKVSGGLEDEVQVIVDQDKLSQLNLSITDIANRLRAENVNLAGGRLEQGLRRFLVRTINEFETVEEFADAIIATRAGRPVYLKDVAKVQRGYKERDAITRYNGNEVIEIALYKEGDSNTVLVASNIEKRLSQFESYSKDRDSNDSESEDGDMTLTVISDQSGFIRAAIDQVTSNAIIGGLIAIVVLYGFLRDARATFIIGLTIPISVIGTFALMHLSNLSLNIMSLGGIALAIGLLVDNAIVVLENIVAKREQGFGIIDAAQRGTSEMAGAVTAATLTTIAVFFPMVFVTGVAGELFSDQSLTVTYALVFSLLLALLLIPMMASSGGRFAYAEQDNLSAPRSLFNRALARLIRGVRWIFSGIAVIGRLVGSLFVFIFGALNSLIASIYKPMLDWSLRHRVTVCVAAVLIFAGTMSLVPRLGTELIPQLSQAEFSINLRLQPGTPLGETDAVVERAFRAAQQVSGITQTFSVTGTGNRLDANPVDAGEHTGVLTVKMQAGTTREDEQAAMQQIRASLNRIPGLAYDFERPALLALSTPLEIVYRGYDMDALQLHAETLAERLRSDDQFTDVRTSIEGGNPEIQIVFDQERAAALGLVVRDIADGVVNNVRGNVATRYSWRDKKIDVTVRSVDTRDASIAQISDLIVNPNSARPVQLSDVARIELATGPSEIRRLDQERVAIVSAGLAYGDLGTTSDALMAELAKMPLSPGVSVDILGQSEEMAESLASMQFTLMLAVFLVYLVMASQFESLTHPFVILFTIPLALVGAVLALFITGTTINVVAFIGVIMLAGIVVNNAIVLVDTINQLRRAGADKLSAIREACASRLRPILMTTLTTALGLLPMALGFGEGAEVRTPMAITVIGGLLTSTFLTLLVIPVVYSLTDRDTQSDKSPNPSMRPVMQ